MYGDKAHSLLLQAGWLWDGEKYERRIQLERFVGGGREATLTLKPMPDPGTGFNNDMRIRWYPWTFEINGTRIVNSYYNNFPAAAKAVLGDNT